MAAVPREAWLVVIAASAAMLVWMLLASTSGGRRSERPRRRSQPRIDWNSIDVRGDAGTATEDSPGDLPRKVAA